MKWEIRGEIKPPSSLFVHKTFLLKWRGKQGKKNKKLTLFSSKYLPKNTLAKQPFFFFLEKRIISDQHFLCKENIIKT
jgi:hypothetical protein